MHFTPPSAILESITPDAEKLIERCGRVSHKSENKITDFSYIEFNKRMINLGHLSVFEHASATFRITCSRGISHELVRHRISSFTQESTRYVKYDDISLTSYFDDARFLNILEKAGTICEKLYEEALTVTTPQYAREVLPTGLTTTLYHTANFRQWREIIQKRLHPAAHPEIQYIASLILKELCLQVPSCFEDLQ